MAKKEVKNLPGAFTLFKPSLDAVLRNWDSFFLFVIVPGLYSQIFNRYLLPKNPQSFHDFVNTPHFGIYTAIFAVITLLALPIVPYLQLKSAKGERVSISEAFNNGVSLFWRLLGLTLLIGLIIMAGFIFFIVPGIIFIRRYILAPYYLIDQNLSISEAMKKSATESKVYSKYIWTVIGVGVLLSLTGALPLIGFYISLLLSTAYSCALAIRYTQIKKSAA